MGVGAVFLIMGMVLGVGVGGHFSGICKEEDSIVCREGSGENSSIVDCCFHIFVFVHSFRRILTLPFRYLFTIFYLGERAIFSVDFFWLQER
jgi:hypothetical protein